MSALRNAAPIAAPILECRNLSVSYATARRRRSGGGRLQPLAARAERRTGWSGNRAAASRPWRSPSCGISGRPAASWGARSCSRGATCWPWRARSCGGFAAPRSPWSIRSRMASLNPSMTIGEQLIEVPMYHEGLGAPRRRRAHVRHAGSGSPGRRRADHALLPASDLRRPAAAHRHRHGAAVESTASAAG